MKTLSLELSSPISSTDSEDTQNRRRSDSTAPTSVVSGGSARWSEIVPPKTALTFAVVWDPDDELVAFSGAHLLGSSPESDDDVKSPNSPSDAYDNRSQVLTIGPSVIPTAENTGTLMFFRENHECFFSAPSEIFHQRVKESCTRTSSTLDGLDVYLRSSFLGKAHLNPNRYYSCFDSLDSDFNFDTRTPFANAWLMQLLPELETGSVCDEGFYESPPRVVRGSIVDNEDEVNLSSAFSVTTTSTSNYVSIRDDDVSSYWSNLEVPNTPSYSRLLFPGSPSSSRRLRKPRPPHLPAPPSAVLMRRGYNHSTPPTSSETRVRKNSCRNSLQEALPKLVRGLGSLKWKRDDDRWVCVEIRQEITQRYL